MERRVEFFFDVGSPYSYLAWHALPAVAAAAGARIIWRPVLLGAVIKATGNHSPFEVSAKMRWVEEDLKRCAQALGAPFVLNPHFPVNTLSAMRIATGLQARRPADFPNYLAAAFKALWVDGRDLAAPEELATVLTRAGFDAPELLALAADPEVKDLLRGATEVAITRGVFGAPTFFVGEQMFWGQDRLEQVARALAAA